MPTPKLGKANLLRDARVYLSGPMDFVASRASEKKTGWRNRVGEFLRRLGVTVFDPWVKPEVRGLYQYGREDDQDSPPRGRWTFLTGDPSTGKGESNRREGAKARAACAEQFWPALHIDLRMVDTSDFVIAYCPTNVYSVGTPHEIILCRQQRKPVLFVSPHVTFPAQDALRQHLENNEDRAGLALLEQLEKEVPVKPNPDGVPSQWYMPLIGGEHFFDGFGFRLYQDVFHWKPIPLDEHEERHRPEKPLLPFLAELNERLPEKWDRLLGKFGPNDDWLLWDLKREPRDGAQLKNVRQARDGG
jgi:hypothetical protein